MTRDISTELHKVIVGFGSNRGPRAFLYQWVFRALSLKFGTQSLKRSSLYETVPVGDLRQPFYLNGAFSFETHSSASMVFEFLKSLEAQAGRKRIFENASRSLDLDFLFYGQENICKKDLVIPHPRFHERAFVLIPTAEIEPDFFDAVKSSTIFDLKSAMTQEEFRSVLIFKDYAYENH